MRHLTQWLKDPTDERWSIIVGVLCSRLGVTEITIDDEEVKTLHAAYRYGGGPTIVLAFDSDQATIRLMSHDEAKKSHDDRLNQN